MLSVSSVVKFLMDESWAAEKLTDLQTKADALRRRFFGRKPRKIGDILSNLIISKAWNQAAGSLAAHSTPISVSRGKLEVTVASNIIMQELGFTKRQIITKLRAALPEAKITDLKLRVGSVN